MDNAMWGKLASLFIIFNNVLLGKEELLYSIYIKKTIPTFSGGYVKHIV
jgi:hypothetical protein